MQTNYVIEEGKTRLVIVRGESLWQSTASDAVSFGALIGTALALNTLMEPSGFINCAIAFVWVLWLFGRAASKRRIVTPDEAAEIVAAWQQRPTMKGDTTDA